MVAESKIAAFLNLEAPAAEGFEEKKRSILQADFNLSRGILTLLLGIYPHKSEQSQLAILRLFLPSHT